MNIKFNSIKATNFMSFSDFEINLDNNGVVEVKGRNDSETLSVSNGSGKSSVFEAIIWNLTGKTSRGSKEVENLVIDEGCQVSLNLSINQDNYQITRSRHFKDSGTNSLEIIKNDKDISGSTFKLSEQVLENELPKELNYQNLTSIVIVSQGFNSRFSSLSPTLRKSRLEELSETDSIIFELSSLIKSTYDKENAKYLSSKKLKDDTSLKIDMLNSQLNSELNRVDSMIKDEDFDEEKEVELLSKFKIEYDKLNSERTDKLQQYNSLKSEVRLKESQVSTSRNVVQDILKKLNSVKNDNSECPTCHQKIVNEDIKSKLIKEYENTVTVESFTQENLQIEIKNNYDKIGNLKVEIDNLEEKQQFLMKDITEKSSKIKSNRTFKKFYEDSSNKIKELKSKILELSESMITYEKESEVHKSKVEIFNKLKSKMSRDFRSFALENVINFINERLKIYSNYLFDLKVIKLQVSGNNVNLLLDNQDSSSLSGGELRRVDIAVQFSLRDLSLPKERMSCNILVLDEILDGIDSYGADSVSEMIMNTNNANSIFIISHLSALSNIPFDKTLNIIKDSNQISRIESFN